LTGVGEVIMTGQIVLWHGITPLSVGKCYMENPVPGINPQGPGAGAAVGQNGYQQVG
jgi:hypothetical protein